MFVHVFLPRFLAVMLKSRRQSTGSALNNAQLMLTHFANRAMQIPNLYLVLHTIDSHRCKRE